MKKLIGFFLVAAVLVTGFTSSAAAGPFAERRAERQARREARSACNQPLSCQAPATSACQPSCQSSCQAPAVCPVTGCSATPAIAASCGQVLGLTHSTVYLSASFPQQVGQCPGDGQGIRLSAPLPTGPDCPNGKCPTPMPTRRSR